MRVILCFLGGMLGWVATGFVFVWRGGDWSSGSGSAWLLAQTFSIGVPAFAVAGARLGGPLKLDSLSEGLAALGAATGFLVGLWLFWSGPSYWRWSPGLHLALTPFVLVGSVLLHAKLGRCFGARLERVKNRLEGEEWDGFEDEVGF